MPLDSSDDTSIKNQALLDLFNNFMMCNEIREAVIEIPTLVV